MPELPEMEAWRRALDDPVRAFPIAKAGPAHIATLKTFDPPLSALEGRRLAGRRAAREAAAVPDRGRRARPARAPDDRRPPPVPARRARRARRRRRSGSRSRAARELVLTEAGAKKRAGVWLLTPEAAEAELAHLGPEALGLGAERLGEILRGRVAAAALAAPRPARDRRHRPRVGERDPPRARSSRRSRSSTDLSPEQVERLADAIDAELARGLELRERGANDAQRLPRPQQARRAVPRLRHADRARRLRGAHDLLLPGVPDRRAVLKDRRLSRLLR